MGQTLERGEKGGKVGERLSEGGVRGRERGEAEKAKVRCHNVCVHVVHVYTWGALVV